MSDPTATGPETGSQTPAEGSGDWVAELQVDDGVRESLRGTGFKTREDLATGYLNLQSKLGDAVQIPGTDATAEERDAFYGKLGRPDSPDGYELDKPDLPDGMEFNENFARSIREMAHAQGLTQAQTRNLFDAYNKSQVEMYRAISVKQQAALKETWDKMKGEWGEQFDGKRKLALRAVEKIGGEELTKYFAEHPAVGNDPVLIKAFVTIGESISEDAFLGSRSGEPGGDEPLGQGTSGFRFDYNKMEGKSKGD